MVRDAIDDAMNRITVNKPSSAVRSLTVNNDAKKTERYPPDVFRCQKMAQGAPAGFRNNIISYRRQQRAGKIMASPRTYYLGLRAVNESAFGTSRGERMGFCAHHTSASRDDANS